MTDVNIRIVKLLMSQQKTSMTKLVTLTLISFLLVPAQLVQAADQCMTTTTSQGVVIQGLLDIPLMEQKESAWCWAASANVFTNRFGYKNSRNRPYIQCEIYNLAKGTSNCCATNPPYPQCYQSGMPWEVFEELSPVIDSNANATPMDFDEITDQICPNGNPGHPFIFIDQTGLTRHTNIIKGFWGFPNSNSTQTLYVDTHYALGSGEVGPKHIEYDCGYKRPNACGKGYSRYIDVRDIKPLNTDVIPPVHPSSLSIQ